MASGGPETNAMLPLPLRGSDDKPSGSSVGRGRGQIKSWATTGGERAVLRFCFGKCRFWLCDSPDVSQSLKVISEGTSWSQGHPGVGCRPSGHPGSASLCGPGQRGHPALGPGALHPSWWGERGPGGGPPWTSGCPAPQRVAPPPTDQVRRSLPPPGVCSALASHRCRAPGVLVTSSERRSRSDALMAPFRAAQQVWPLPGGAANSGAPRLPSPRRR